VHHVLPYLGMLGAPPAAYPPTQGESAEVKWKRAVDRWNLCTDDDEIIGAVTHQVLNNYPELFEAERRQRDWPLIPLPVEKPYAIPLSPAQVLAILDGLR
jgi:hypothetical protein